jgi:hypothetical protein
MAVNAQKMYEIDIEDVEYIRHGDTQMCHGQLAARADRHLKTFITHQAAVAQTPPLHRAGCVRDRLLPHHNTTQNRCRPDQQNRCSW